MADIHNVKRKTGKKRMVIICALVVLVLLFTTVIGTVIWYHDSPFPTVVKLMDAVKDKDMDAMLDCIEPEKAAMMRRLLSYFNIDTSALMDRLMPDESNFGGSGPSKIKFAGYHKDGDTAYFEIKIIDDDGSVTDTNRINFVRIDGIWYLAFSFGF